MRIAINGAGIAGPTLAYWLRMSGHEPVLFERAQAFRTGGYLIDFWGVGYDIAERMGLIPALLRRSYLMERMRFVAGDGHQVAALDLRPMRDALGGRFISLARVDLAQALIEACTDVPIHFGTSIVALQETTTGVVTTLSDGRTERYDLVVGAGGLHSRVRHLVFGPQGTFERALGCYVAAFRLPNYPHRDDLTYVSHTVPKRQVARVTLRDAETLILLVCRDDLMPDAPSASDAKKAIRRAFAGMAWEVPAILDAMDQVDEVYFDRVSQIHLPRWSSGRVTLLGDAAACPSLLAGEGTGLAMLEAYVLAGELHRARGDFALAFAAYESRLRPFVTAKQRSALRLRGFFAPRTALALKARDFGVKVLSTPAVGKWLVARSLGEGLVLPEYFAA